MIGKLGLRLVRKKMAKTKRKAVKNYTTTISVEKTITEVQFDARLKEIIKEIKLFSIVEGNK